MFEKETLPIRRLDRSRSHEFRFTPDVEALEELSKENNWRRIDLEDYSGKLTPNDEGWLFETHIKGHAVLNCVISHMPVHHNFDINVTRQYVREEKDVPVEMSWDLDFNTDIEPMPQNLELTDVLRESLLLEFPEFPRHPKYEDESLWEYAPQDEGEEETTRRPFADLKALMEKKNSENS